MIDWNVCLVGFVLGLFICSAACLIEFVVSSLASLMLSR